MVNDFASLTANRKARAAARQQFGIFRVCANGQLAKTPTATEETTGAAATRRDYLARVNPGRVYVVRSL